MSEKATLTKTSENKAQVSLSKRSNENHSQSLDSPVEQILQMQQTMGNQAVQKLFDNGTIQAKLTIGQPNDKYEQEADRVADQVMRMSEPKGSLVDGNSSMVQRQASCPGCPDREEIQTKSLADQITSLVQRQVGPEEEEEPIQTKLIQRQENEEEEVQAKIQRQTEEEEEPLQAKQANNQIPAVTPTIESGINSIRGGGQPLPESTRSYFEPRFGKDFSQVRVHTDSKADEASKSVNAKAFTTGKNVVFGAGQYSPGTSTGKSLLAHELVHVVQQAPSVTQSAPSVQWYTPYTGDGSRLPGHDVVTLETSTAPRIYRQARPDEAQTEAALTIDHRDPAMFAALLEALDQIGELRSSGYFPLVVRGQSFQVTTEQIVQLRQTAVHALQRAASRVLISAEGDLEGYEYQHRIDEDQYIVSTIVQFFGRVQDPGLQLRAKVRKVRAAYEAVRVALSTSRLADALHALESAERASREAHRLWREFHEGTISAGEGAVRVLTFTRDASFVTLGVLAVIASGGAATSTVLGFEVGTTSAATAVSVGAPIVARVGEAGVRAGLGEQVDWTRIAVDTAVDLVLVRLGGHLSQELFQRLGGNPAVRSLGTDLSRRVFASVLTHEGTTALRVIVDATYRRLHGQEITWEQFGNALLDQMTDPRGVFIAVLMGAVQTAADRRHGTPREFDVRNREGRPLADIDEMQGGTLYEDKNAAGLYVIPPGCTRPQQTEVQWAKRQIYDATVRRLTGIPERGVTTAQGRQAGSTRTVPTLAEVQAARRYVFRIELDNPALRAAVGAQLARLRVQFPGWTFDAFFGYRPIRQ